MQNFNETHRRCKYTGTNFRLTKIVFDFITIPYACG